MSNAESTESFLIESPRSVLWYALGPTGGVVVAAVITLVLIALSLRIRDDHIAFACLGWAWIALAPDWQVHYFVVPLVATVPLISRGLNAIASHQPIQRTGGCGADGAAVH
jgi:hypothetical protein